MKKTLVAISDLHCGHWAGLTPPEWQPRVPKGCDRHIEKRAELRASLWRWFERERRPYRSPDVLLINGDAIDGKGPKSGGTELLYSDRVDQVAMAADVIKSFKPKRIVMTHGTPYHVGTEEDWESLVAKDKNVGADIHAEVHMDINGVIIAAKHHIGNSTSPVSRFTAMSSAQVKQQMWSLHDQQPAANLILRSHIHRCYGVMDPAMNFAGWVTPALQGLGSKVARKLDGLPVHFGFLVVEIESLDSWTVIPRVCSLRYQAATVVTV